MRGRLRDGVGTVEALRALFPAGSMTGAPKLRTMSIIEAVEDTARGVYAGAFGWVGADGRADLGRGDPLAGRDRATATAGATSWAPAVGSRCAPTSTRSTPRPGGRPSACSGRCALSDDVVTRLRAAGCVFAEEEAALLVEAAADADELEAMVARRVAGEPLEYVVGWAEFCGLRMVVEPGVFVPRHRTELLVDEAERLVRDVERPVVVDLCCGSGALGAALGGARDVELYAADVDPAAVRCARVNVATAGGQVFEGDLFDALPARAARPRRRPAGQRALRADGRDRADAARGARPRAPGDASTAAPTASTLLRRVSAEAPQLAGPGRSPALRVERATGARDVRACSGPTASSRGVVRSEDLGATVVTGRTQETGW